MKKIVVLYLMILVQYNSFAMQFLAAARPMHKAPRFYAPARPAQRLCAYSKQVIAKHEEFSKQQRRLYFAIDKASEEKNKMLKQAALQALQFKYTYDEAEAGLLCGVECSGFQTDCMCHGEIQEKLISLKAAIEPLDKQQRDLKALRLLLLENHKKHDEFLCAEHTRAEEKNKK